MPKLMNKRIFFVFFCRPKKSTPMIPDRIEKKTGITKTGIYIHA